MTQKKIISGIQQIGIGVSDIKSAWSWYCKAFGTDVKVFEDKTVAELMLPYTGGSPWRRHAALAINLQGGGGFEIWQYTERVPQPPAFQILLGDTGIYAAKIKCKDINQTFQLYKERGYDLIGDVQVDPLQKATFFVRDPFGNIFQLVESNDWFGNENKATGGIYGAIIGVSDIDKSMKLYRDILGYTGVKYDVSNEFTDFGKLPGGSSKFRRVLLRLSNNKGGFSNLLGPSEIELVQVLDRAPNKIFKNRFWGDMGFIHICFDIIGMDALKKECLQSGCAFTVDSSVKHNNENSFDMGEAAGHFSYIEDPDGTLIEFVETHKVPIIKKIGWYLNVRKRNPEIPISNWIIKALRFNKVAELKE